MNMRRTRDSFWRVQRALSRPKEELRGAQRTLRYFVDLTRHCARELYQDRAEQMAAALSYRTIFALVPIVMLGLVIFRIFGGFEDVQTNIQSQLYGYFGVPQVSYSERDVQPGERVIVEVPDPADEIAEEQRAAARGADDPSGGQAVDEEEEDERRQVRASIQKALSELTAKIASLDFASIGTLGVALFIYAGMALAIAVEDDFNIIYGAPHGRPWHIRLAIYWSILTLGTGLLSLSLYVSGRAVDRAAAFGFDDPWVTAMHRLLALVASWILLFSLYSLMPNTSVHVRPAAMGSLVAAILWETGKAGFQFYVTQALPYWAWYGSLGLIPLFLFWIYISWLIVLFGLELTYTLQVMHGKVPRRQEEEPVTLPGDPEWFIPMLVQIGHAFAKGEAIGRQALAEQLGLPSRVVHEFGTHLEEVGMVHLIPSKEGDVGYTLARPPSRIALAEVLKIGNQLALRYRERLETPGWSYVERLNSAQLEAAGATTLAELIEHDGRESKTHSGSGDLP